jgi:hypothetical protein
MERQAYRETDMKTDRCMERQAYRETDIRTDRYMERQAYRDLHKDRQMHGKTSIQRD